MNKWLIWTVIAGSLCACSDQDILEDESLEILTQVDEPSVDGGAQPLLDAAISESSADGGTNSQADAGDETPSTGEAGGVGAACEADSDCTAVGAGARCTKAVSIPFGGISINFAGGYCSKPCTTDSECGAGNGCPLAGAAAFLPDIAQCLKQCSADSECRQGYSCTALPSLPGLGGPAGGSAQKHCLPPLPFPSGGALPGLPGLPGAGATR